MISSLYQDPYTLTTSPYSGEVLGKTSLPERAKTQVEKVLPFNLG
jgi:hypothetical protein